MPATEDVSPIAGLLCPDTFTVYCYSQSPQSNNGFQNVVSFHPEMIVRILGSGLPILDSRKKPHNTTTLQNPLSKCSVR